MKLVDTSIGLGELRAMAEGRFGDLVKAVVDVRELTRLREVLLYYLVGSNEFGSSDAAWHRYFHPFGFAAAQERERRVAS